MRYRVRSDMQKPCRPTVSFRYTKRSVMETGRPRPAKRARRPFSFWGRSRGRADMALLTEQDLYLFNQGRHYRAYQKLGAHLTSVNGEAGATFGVWAPNAHAVTVMGSFNNWNKDSHPLRARENSGIWEDFIPGITKGSLYKYHIVSRH